MKRGAFTLIEMIFVVLISAILAMGSFKAMKALYLRSAKAKAVTDMSLRSQIVLDQIGVMLYNRVPNSVIGYDTNESDSCEAIASLTEPRTILEWLGTMDDELLNREYDGYIDMGDSNKTTHILSAKNIDKTLDDTEVINLLFAGSFDEGAEESNSACHGAFGWHGNDSNLSYSINIDNDNDINLTDSDEYQPEYIYEKYYLSSTAYAIARGENIEQNASCLEKYNMIENSEDINNTLFLFYNFKPFGGKNGIDKGKTFCADTNGTKEGNVSILAKNVTAFEAVYFNQTIRINLDMNRTIRGSKSNVHISKQKVIF